MRLKKRRPAKPLTFWDHVAELRVRLIVSLLAIGLTSVLGLFLYNWLLDNIFLPPYCRVLDSQGIDRACTLVITEPLDGFKTRIRVAIYVGIVLYAASALESLEICHTGSGPTRKTLRRPLCVKRGSSFQLWCPRCLCDV